MPGRPDRWLRLTRLQRPDTLLDESWRPFVVTRTVTQHLVLLAVLIGSPAAAEPSVPVHVNDLLDLGHRSVRVCVLCCETRRLFISHTEERDDDRLYQWNVDTKTVEHIYRLGDGYMCDNVALSPDGRTVVVGCWPLDSGHCKVLLLDANQKTIARDLGHSGRVFAVRFNRDGSRFVMRSSETINLPDAAYLANGESL